MSPQDKKSGGIETVDGVEPVDYPYEETVLAADTGTVSFRDYGNGDVWLGVREGNEPGSPPKVFIQLTLRQQRVLSGLFIDCRKYTLPRGT